MRRLFAAAILIAAAARGQELRLDYVRESLIGRHAHYRQYIDGIRVVGGERIEGPLGTRESLARRGFSHVEASVMTAHRGDVVYVNVDGVARLAVRVRSDDGGKPVAAYFDASTGAVLRVEPLYFSAAARVFDVNPVAKLNNPALQDQNDAASAVPDAAYATVDLLGLAASGPLSGPNVRIVDTQAPFTARAEASQSLLFDRSQSQFEEVNAYYLIDTSERYLESLGYAGARRIMNYAIPVDAHAANGADNSFYVQDDVPGQGALFFGDGGTDDAEDADIVIHEFGHAIQDAIAPGAFNGSAASEARALAEGYSDYWAFSAKYAQTLASGRDPFCLADWDARCWLDTSDQKCGYPAGSDCLRRVDSTKTMADFVAVDHSGFEHRNGAIWSSALKDIRVATDRRTADTLVIEGMFGTPSNPTFAGQARRMLAVDTALNGGANNAVICRAMTLRGILDVGTCGAPPRGEVTLFQSTTSTIHVSDARAIDDVMVRVQTDARPGRVTLIAPDGTSVLLTEAPRLDATYGVNALPEQSLAALHNRMAAGDWKLVVESARLRAWSLMIHFAGDAPLTTRPVATGSRKHIPAVAHVIGAANTTFISDVRLYNRSNTSASITAIFTPSGRDGTTQFAAIKLVVQANQLLVLNDIVHDTLQSTGTGTLELLGDTDRVIVNSRMYTPAGTATCGQTIPSFDTTAAGADQIAPLQNATDFRSNVGIAEVSGAAGVVRFTFFTAGGATIGASDVAVAAYSHAQIRVPFAGTDMRAQVSVVSGNALVIAYGSVVDNLSGDAVTIPAARLPQIDEEVAIPAIHAAGAAGTNWRTDLWRTMPDGVVSVARDAGSSLGALFLATHGAVVSSRTYTSSDRGTFGELVASLRPPAAAPQELIGIEQSPQFRTNVGLVNFGTAAATATVIVYDAAGTEAGRTVATVGGRSLQQLPLAAIVSGNVESGRIEVRGPVAAYASVVDNGTQDPTYIAGQY